MLAIIQQNRDVGVFQHGLLALQGMARLQRQVHRATSQHREDAGVQIKTLAQADADHGRRVAGPKQRP